MVSGRAGFKGFSGYIPFWAACVFAMKTVDFSGQNTQPEKTRADIEFPYWFCYLKMKIGLVTPVWYFAQCICNVSIFINDTLILLLRFIFTDLKNLHYVFFQKKSL